MIIIISALFLGCMPINLLLTGYFWKGSMPLILHEKKNVLQHNSILITTLSYITHVGDIYI